MAEEWKGYKQLENKLYDAIKKKGLTAPEIYYVLERLKTRILAEHGFKIVFTEQLKPISDFSNPLKKRKKG